jgi:hypothetical protein
MSKYEDSSGQTVNSQLCSYTSLDKYNIQSPGVTPPIPTNTSVGYYTVPTWNYRLPYNTLSSNSSCSGYPGITDAYGKDAVSCAPQYTQQPCCRQGQCS